MQLVLLFIAATLGMTLIVTGIVADVFIVIRLLKRRWSWRSQVERLCGREWRWRDGALLLAALIAAHLLLGWYFAKSGYPEEGAESTGAFFVVAQTLPFHAVCGAAILLLMRIRGWSWQRAFGNAGGETNEFLRNALRGVMFYVAAMPPVILLALLYRFFLGLFDIAIDPQEVITMFVSSDCPLWLRIYLCILAVGVAPVIEEICFRGIALPLLARHGGVGPGIIAVSLLFAAVHFHVPSIAPLFGIAVAFSLGYVCTGSIVTPIVMHAIFNAVSITALLLLRSMPLHLAGS